MGFSSGTIFLGLFLILLGFLVRFELRVVASKDDQSINGNRKINSDN